MTVREIINELLQYDPGMKVTFIHCKKKKANDYLSYMKTERDTDSFVSILLEGDKDE